MSLITQEQDLGKLIMVGDRVLIRPKDQQGKTASGLFLPPSVVENEKTHSGYVVSVGPGYPIPAMTEGDEPWKEKKMMLNMFRFRQRWVTWQYI
jgi:hypothetical protein